MTLNGQKLFVLKCAQKQFRKQPESSFVDDFSLFFGTALGMNIRGLEKMNKTFSPRTFEQMNYNVEPINFGMPVKKFGQGLNYSWLVSDARFKQISFPKCDETTDEIKDWAYCLRLTKCNETCLDLNLSNPSTIISLEIDVIRTAIQRFPSFGFAQHPCI